MRTLKLTLIAAAAALAAGAATAADVTVYGLVDYGLMYSNLDNGVTTTEKTEMTSGQNLGSRFGFKGTEDLGNGVTVGFILENGFSADTGALPASGNIFDRESTLFLQGKAGMIKFGRMTRITGSTGSTNIYVGSISPMSTGYGDNIPGYNAIFAGNLLRFGNTITYTTPDFAGLKIHAQYSGGYDMAEGEDENQSTTDRYMGLGMTYKNGAFNMAGAVEKFNWKSAGLTASDDAYADDGLVVSAGGAYDFGVVKFFLMGAYFDHMPLSLGFLGDSAKLGAAYTNNDRQGLGVNTGINAPALGGNLRLSFAYLASEASADGVNADLDRTNVTAAWEYKFSKQTIYYMGAAWTQDDYEDFEAQRVGATLGLIHAF